MGSQKPGTATDDQIMQAINAINEMRDNLVDLSFAMREFLYVVDSNLYNDSKSITDEILRRIKEEN